MPTCLFCNGEVSEKAKFCPGCGKEVLMAGYCPSCGAKLLPGMKFCDQCGFKVVKPEGKTEKTESKQIPEEKEDIKQKEIKRTCPECNEMIIPGKKFCFSCGHLIKEGIDVEPQEVKKKNFCHACGSMLSPGEDICEACKGEKTEVIIRKEIKTEIKKEMPGEKGAYIVAQETTREVDEPVEGHEEEPDEETITPGTGLEKETVKELEPEIQLEKDAAEEKTVAIKVEKKEALTEGILKEEKVEGIETEKASEIKDTEPHSCVAEEVKAEVAEVKEAEEETIAIKLEKKEDLKEEVLKEEEVKKIEPEEFSEIKDTEPHSCVAEEVKAEVEEDEEKTLEIKAGEKKSNRLCPGCNKELIEYKNFCPFCGHNLLKEEEKPDPRSENIILPAEEVCEYSDEATEEAGDFKEKKTPEDGEIRLCPECGIEISKDEEVCEICRDETTVIFEIKKEPAKAIPENLCPGCSKGIIPGKNFCPFCGHRLIEEKIVRVYEENIDEDEKTLKITEKEKDLSEEVKKAPDKTEVDFTKVPPEDASPKEDLSGSTMALDKVLKEEQTVQAVTGEETGEDTIEGLTLLSDKTPDKKSEEIKVEEKPHGSTISLDEIPKEADEEIFGEKVKDVKPEAIEKKKAVSAEVISGKQVLPVLLILCLMAGIFLVIRSFNPQNTVAVNTPNPFLKETLIPLSESTVSPVAAEITPSGDETPVEVADASPEPDTPPTAEPAKITPVTLPISVPSPTQIPAVIPTPVPVVPTVAVVYNPPVPVYNNYNNEPENNYTALPPTAVPAEISYVDLKRTYCNEYIRNVIQPLYSAGKYDEAIEECHLIISHEKNYYVNYLWMANCLLAYGAVEEAKYYIDMAWKLEYNERNRIDYGNSESSKLYDRYRELGGRE